MASNVRKGFLGKLFKWLLTAAIIFCTVYVVLDMLGKSGQSGKIGQIGELAEKTKVDTSNSIDELNANNKKLALQVSELQKQNRSFTNEIKQLSYKIADSGIKWQTNLANNHKYCLTPSLPWHLAEKWAREQGGTLVVINNEEENKWLVDTFGGETEFWIGLTDEAAEGQWFWVIGSPAQYFNWYKGEPDNFKNFQHYGIINSRLPGMWNDVEANDSRVGIMEKN